MSFSIVKLTRFAIFCAKEGLSWYRRHGRLPRTLELYDLSRKALWRFRTMWSRNLPVPKWLETPLAPYDAWLKVNEWNDRGRDDLMERLGRASDRLPLISIVMPVHDPPLQFLERAIASVCEQVHAGWELCIADDGSLDPKVWETLIGYASHDHRIKVTRLGTNMNISHATNEAVRLASGDFLLFLDHDDELTPDAVGEVALYLARHPRTDLVYSDDDKIDTAGRRYAPQFKPDWSPELLLSYMYLSHCLVVRRTLFLTVGGMRAGFEGSQDYDLVLRMTETTSAVGHIPRILYHWRSLPESTASSGMAKPASIEAGRRAIAESMERRGIIANVSQPEFAAAGYLGLYNLIFPDEGPAVTILIPTKNQVSILRRCIESIKVTTYRNYQVVIIDNESDDPETIAYLKTLPHRVLRIANPAGRFNFSAINNRAVELIDSEFVLFLNNDTEVRSPRWLSQMVGYGRMQGIGAVGAKLIFEDGRIQHAGIVHGYYHGMAGPAFKLTPASEHGYLAYLSVSRNYSAVTAACLLTPRAVFRELGGFNETEFGVAYNDVDYCYRLVDQGYRCVFCPEANLIHYEGYSRGVLHDPAEVAAFKQKYRRRPDPWYSAHLSLSDETFRITPRRVGTARPKPIPILMVGHNLNYEGAPWSQYDLTVELTKRGVIQPIVLSPQDGPLRALYEQQGISVKVDQHPLRGVTNAGEYEPNILALTAKCRSWGVEMIYANTLQTFYAIDAADRAGLPCIWNPRESEPWNTYFDYLPDGVLQRAYQCFAIPYRIVFVSDATRDAYAALDTRHNFTVIRNGLNMMRLDQAKVEWTRTKARLSLGLQDNEVMLLLLGTVCDRKGQHDLARALAKLKLPLHTHLQCYIVGDRPGDYSTTLHRLLKMLPASLAKRVHVVPETRQTALYYAAADIFLCTSKLESYPRVLLEAMAYELPIITTPVFGIREQVREGINTLHYKPGDVKGLADCLKSLIDSESLRLQMARNSRHVLAFGTDFDEMISAYADVITEAWFTRSGNTAAVGWSDAVASSEMSTSGGRPS